MLQKTWAIWWIWRKQRHNSQFVPTTSSQLTTTTTTFNTFSERYSYFRHPLVHFRFKSSLSQSNLSINMSADKGAKIFAAKCSQCHNTEKVERDIYAKYGNIYIDIIINDRVAQMDKDQTCMVLLAENLELSHHFLTLLPIWTQVCMQIIRNHMDWNAKCLEISQFAL